MKPRFRNLTIGLFTAIAILAATGFVTPSPAAAATNTCPTVFWGSLAKSSATTTAGTHATAVRTGRHQCYDRMVFDLDGAATGYTVEYVTKLFHEGSGAEVPVAGGAIIQIRLNAAGYDDNGNPTISSSKVDGTNVGSYKTFRDVAWAGSFEGQTTVGLGARARLPFRVFALSGPGSGSRLVVDVAHRW